MKQKNLVMLAPSFIAQFDYPEIVHQLKQLGYDKVVELTFGAKMVNREYHKILDKKENKNKFYISSVCSGITQFIDSQMPQFKANLIPVDSPMLAMAKICKKTFPNHKITFIAPCHFKKLEAEAMNKKLKKKLIDKVICFDELQLLIQKKKIKNNNPIHFDKFYNDYTKIYPLAGGLSKTAHLKGVLKKGEEVIIDGIESVKEFLNNKNKQERYKKVRFADINFCVGGCIGGPCITKKYSLEQKKARMKKYLAQAKLEDIPKSKEGLIKRAKGINFLK